MPTEPTDGFAANQVHRNMDRSSRLLQEHREENCWKTNSFLSFKNFLVPRRARLCSKSMNGFDRVNERDGQQFTPETCFHRVISMGMINEIPISSQGPKGSNMQFLQDAERNAANFGKIKPRYFILLVQAHKRLGSLFSTPTTQRERKMSLQDKLRKCIL